MKKLLTLSSFLLLTTFTACTELNDPYGYGNSGGYYGNRYDDDYYSRSRRNDWERQRRHEERELDRERGRLEDERRRVEEQRRRDRDERCPSGYSPSERKCSTEERRRGCKDMRLSNGLGCVRR
jgi:hypothetical protein